MQIIPVIDLQNGIVVHARQGHREHYTPLQSVICKSPDIFDVIEAYYRVFGFDKIYIADLNAIANQGDNRSLLLKALLEFPGISFWIDAGYPLAYLNLTNLSNYLPVLGSESFPDDKLDEIGKFGKPFVLSLDFAASGKLGAKTLFDHPEFWPENIIIMSLAKVGSNTGPDLDKLVSYRTKFPAHNFIASGGVRDFRDLITLQNIGIRYALVATALHNGKLSPLAIKELQTKKYPG